MPSLPFQNQARDLSRFRKIIQVFFEEGVFVEELHLRTFVPFYKRIRFSLIKKRKERSHETHKSNSIRLRHAFERLGPSFIKLGQIMSLRPDIIGEDYATELKKLLADVPPFPYRDAKKIIEEDLGQPLSKLFKKFEKKPIAAASIAQVHKAVLPTGEKVAVKVQRPNIETTLKEDIRILQYLAHFIEQRSSAARKYRPVKVIQEFADWTTREIDFTIEAMNGDRLQNSFKEDPTIGFPKVHWDYTSKRVLTEEFSHGITIFETKKFKYWGVNRELIAKRAIAAGFKQFFTDGFFHADPHPGNFFILKDNVLCLHDFGIVGTISPEQRAELIIALRRFLNKDFAGYRRHVENILETTDQSNTSAFWRDVEDMLNHWRFAPPSHRESVAKIFFEMIQKGVDYQVYFPTDFVLIAKALVTLESWLLEFYPEFDLDSELTLFLSKAFRQSYHPKKIAQELQTSAEDYLTLIRTLPERVQTLMSTLEKGKVSIKIDLSEFENFKRELSHLNNIRTLSMLALATGLGSAILLRLEEGALQYGFSVGRIGLLMSVLLVFWLIYEYTRKR